VGEHKSKWRLAAFVIAGIFGSAVLVAVVGLFLILRPVPVPAVHIDPAAAQRLAEELQHAQTMAASGIPAVVRADDTALNSMLQPYLHSAAGGSSGTGRASLRDMKLSINDDRLRIYALIHGVGPKDIAVVFEGKVRTMNGYLDFEPITGTLGALPIPQASMKRALQQLAADPANHQLLRLPMNLSDVHVADSKIVLTYK
jgi:hypothetical protein